MANIEFNYFLKLKFNNQNQQAIVLTITMGYDRTQVFTGLWIEKNYDSAIGGIIIFELVIFFFGIFEKYIKKNYNSIYSNLSEILLPISHFLKSFSVKPKL